MEAAMNKADHPMVEIARRAEWRDWLQIHHGSHGSIWLVYPRRAADPEAISYDEIVDEALCFGWIDSLPRKLDPSRSMLRLSPRRAASAWSGVNKRRVEKLLAAGLMQPAGIAAIAAARVNGAWHALDEADSLLVPDDLAAAMASSGDARRFFDAFPPSTRRGILEWIAQAKRPATRAARIAETAKLAAANRRANQWRG
jgi:uncharacterized protein YdeI (YjbR/CyaY-like superfamily)